MKSNKPIAVAALASVMLVSTSQLAAAATVSTSTYLAEQGQAATVGAARSDTARITAFLQRDDVSRQLQAYGVTPEEAQARVAALGDADIARIESRIDGLPAGGSVFALVGVTDIFKKL